MNLGSQHASFPDSIPRTRSGAGLSPVRLGILGCGNVLDAYVPQCLRLQLLGQVELVLACGRAGQGERALRLGVPRFTEREEDILESNEIDGVLVLTSMSSHARLAMAALRAGKHVLVEKPLATTLEDADALLALAATSPKRLICAPFTSLSPTLQTMGARINRGDIGKPCSARARYGWAGPDWSEWFYKPGGGCLFDLGVYALTSLTALLGPVRRVTAMVGVAIPERRIRGQVVRVEVEDNAQVLLDFGGGTFASVTTGFTLQQYRSPALEIYGSEGTLQMLGDDWDPDGYEFYQNAAGCWQVYKETHPEWSWTDGLNHWVRWIREGVQPGVTLSHARHVLEIILRARESAAEGVMKAVDSTFERPTFETSAETLAAHRQHDRTRQHE